jgi:hypothetical protein
MTQVSVPQMQPSRRTGGLPGPFVLVLVGVLLAIAAGTAVAGWRLAQPAGPLETASHTQSLDGASRANLHLQFAAGDLTIGVLDGREGVLATMSYNGPADLRPEPSYRVGNGLGELAYISRDGEGPHLNMPFIGRTRDHGDMRVQLARGIPLALDIQAGAADSMLDLTGLNVGRLDLQTGAADTRIRLPESAGRTDVVVKGGVTDLAVDVPSSVAADIYVSSGLAGREIDQARFRSLSDGHYRSPDFDTAANRVDMRIELGIAQLTIR